jgi:hypothetical protein
MMISAREITMAKRDDWQDLAKGILKAELKRRNLSYGDLADRLKAVGVIETQRNLRNKISRGTFSASFFLQCLTAVGVHTLRLDGS